MDMNDWRGVRNILCVRLDAFGDVLMTEPALRALHQSMPNCKLTLLTSPAGAQSASMVPYLDEIISYEAPWMKHGAETDGMERHFDCIERLRSLKFDAAIIFTVYTQNPLPPAMMCYLAKIPRRMAFCRENPYRLLTHWVPEKEPQGYIRHEVERQLALVAEIGATVDREAIQIVLPETASNAAETLWGKLARHEEYRIVVHPGASAASRRYPAERFATAMKLIRSRYPAAFIITGDFSEQDLAEQLAADTGSVSVAGRLDTHLWAAIIESADLLLSNNTGAAHIAAATGTPVVVAYALTNPQHTPWRATSRVMSNDVPCKNCYKSICPEGHHRCLLGIDPHEIADAAHELLAAGAQYLHTPVLPAFVKIAG